jgi:hypothetical protein
VKGHDNLERTSEIVGTSADSAGPTGSPRCLFDLKPTEIQTTRGAIMLSAFPIGWCSWSFQIEDHVRAVATIDMHWVRERANVRIGDEDYKLGRYAFVRGTFELRHGGVRVAKATKRALIRSFDVEAGGRRFKLSAISMFGRAMGLYENGQLIGKMAPFGIWSRRANVNFPDDLPLEVRVFLIWLVLILWRRAASSAAAAG